MACREDLEVPSNVKGWGDPRPWSDVEQALEAAMASLIARSSEGCGFVVAYVPHSPLGQDEGVDLSWEVNFGLGPCGQDTYELAGHPAAVVEELVTSISTVAEVTVPSEVEDLVHQAARLWRGWSQLLADVARLCCHLPDEDAGMELSVGYTPTGECGLWRWTVAIPVPGTQYPASEWEGSSPVEVLGAALEEADVWLQGLPAGHLRVL
ncbi:hypothetical protein [Kineosporia sp. NBRC 101731]|uniref:hypothetical protein n=1 Tax=Kineosporia sp. NBRC 101731 TaxID=3032199 RepID=UPI0024A51630|nr:hypothetical protein [Kineosporia sp. NBRC 101731]GLY29355.1 hypothetical protein Kisp02_27200 [Kineosporia sp. NBRC 101731]